MKNNLIYVLVLLLSCTNAQVSNSIQYSRKMNVAGTSVFTKYELQVNVDQQLSNFVFKGLLEEFESDTISNKIDAIDEKNVIENIVIVKKSNNPPPITNQKNFKSNELLSYESIYGEKELYLIKEELPEFEWQIANETKEILGYKTQKATTEFRGRKYEIWFAPEINLHDGPWKFYGLPGLILEVKSEDGFIEFLAYELHLNTTYASLENLSTKYKNISAIDFRKKKQIEAKNINKQKKFLQSQNPLETNVKIETNDLEIVEY
ncbi:MAG: GLPGLI family protein [Weeksellaceae bacterium]|nr:GLPGLI family protein [Weeksellaceae bacterium]